MNFQLSINSFLKWHFESSQFDNLQAMEIGFADEGLTGEIHLKFTTEDTQCVIDFTIRMNKALTDIQRMKILCFILKNSLEKQI